MAYLICKVFLDYKIDMFASSLFAHAYQTCQKCALALSIITVAHDYMEDIKGLASHSLPLMTPLG